MLILLTRADNGLPLAIPHGLVLMVEKERQGKIHTVVVTGIQDSSGRPAAFPVRESVEEVGLMVNRAFGMKEGEQIDSTLLGFNQPTIAN